jgi:hypothetical protein
MASGWTNRGAYLMFLDFFRNTSEFTNFYVALVTDATTPTVDHNTLGQFTEIAAGNGYTSGGFQLARNATDFDSATEDDTDNRMELQIKNVAWTASGGSIPSSGSGARWALLTTDEGTVANRQVIGWWDLTSNRTATVGQVLTLIDLELRGGNA